MCANWAAANSSARGLPSSRAQTSATAAIAASSISMPGRAAIARSRTRRTAELLESELSSEGTVYVRSPSTSSASREVAKIRQRDPDDKISSTRSATSSIRCSQLSRTSSKSLPAKAVAASSVSRIASPAASATVETTSDGSLSGANAAKNTPSGNSSTNSAAAASASRVLPAPPMPVKVTSRFAASSVASCVSSSSRPINSVRCTGWLLRTNSRDRNVGTTHRRVASTPRRRPNPSSDAPQGRQRKAAFDRARRQLGQQDLSTVTSRHDPGSPVQNRSEVVAVALLSRTTVKPYPDPKLR
jgi:hypothetical protein